MLSSGQSGKLKTIMIMSFSRRALMAKIGKTFAASNPNSDPFFSYMKSRSMTASKYTGCWKMLT